MRYLATACWLSNVYSEGMSSSRLVDSPPASSASHSPPRPPFLALVFALYQTPQYCPSVHVGNDLPSHNLLVLFPIPTVLGRALLIVASVAMNEKDGKVQDVKVRKDHAPASGLTRNHLTTIEERDGTLGLGSS